MPFELPLRAVDDVLELNKLLAISKPKLQKIELPKFSGDVTKFCLFWERIESTVEHNPNLYTIDKFNYLKTLLEGSAVHSVQGLSLTEANYAAATDILKERFGRIPSHSSDRTGHLYLVYDKVHANV